MDERDEEFQRAAGPPMRGDDAQVVADGLMSISAAARFLSISRSMLYGMMENGQLVYVKIGRARRIPRRALIALAAINLHGGWKCWGR